MDTTTLDGKIREQAQREWRAKVHECFGTLHRSLGIHNMNVPTKVRYDSNNTEPVVHVLSWAQDAITEHGSKAYEDKAVAAFIAKVESLQEQIDALNIQQQQ